MWRKAHDDDDDNDDDDDDDDKDDDDDGDILNWLILLFKYSDLLL